MSDKDLLALAAKAAGMHTNMWAEPGELVGKGGWVQNIAFGLVGIWNPLTDDGDALRLAVKLEIDLHRDVQKPKLHGSAVMKYINACARESNIGAAEQLGTDPYAATRRAIVRAAAEIAKATP